MQHPHIFLLSSASSLFKSIPSEGKISLQSGILHPSMPSYALIDYLRSNQLLIEKPNLYAILPVTDDQVHLLCV